MHVGWSWLGLGMCTTSGTGGFACEEKVKAKEMGIEGWWGACLPVGIESQEGTSTCKSFVELLQ